ncbi:Tudor domain-containing protein [Entamoeba marina]
MENVDINIKNEITQAELDLNDLLEMLTDDPDNTELMAMKTELENTIVTLKSQLHQMEITNPSDNIQENTPSEPINKYKEKEQVLAYSERDKGWFCAFVSRVVNNEKCWVRFGPRDHQLISNDNIKPFEQIDRIEFSTVEKKRYRKVPDVIPSELPKWTKPKPKKRHAIKSLMKQKEEEDALRAQKNNWKSFVSKLKK